MTAQKIHTKICSIYWQMQQVSLRSMRSQYSGGCSKADYRTCRTYWTGGSRPRVHWSCSWAFMQMVCASTWLMWGRLVGSVCSMARISWRRSLLYFDDIGANVPRTIFMTRAGRLWTGQICQNGRHFSVSYLTSQKNSSDLSLSLSLSLSHGKLTLAARFIFHSEGGGWANNKKRTIVLLSLCELLQWPLRKGKSHKVKHMHAWTDTHTHTYWNTNSIHMIGIISKLPCNDDLIKKFTKACFLTRSLVLELESLNACTSFDHLVVIVLARHQAKFGWHVVCSWDKKKIALPPMSSLAAKWGSNYSRTMSFVRQRLSVAILRASVHCAGCPKEARSTFFGRWAALSLFFIKLFWAFDFCLPWCFCSSSFHMIKFWFSFYLFMPFHVVDVFNCSCWCTFCSYLFIYYY